jgi:hypothetical protein
MVVRKGKSMLVYMRRWGLAGQVNYRSEPVLGRSFFARVSRGFLLISAFLSGAGTAKASEVSTSRPSSHIAVVGDEWSLGFFASEKLVYEPNIIFDLLSGKTARSQGTTTHGARVQLEVLGVDGREFMGPVDYMSRVILSAFVRAYVQNPRLAWHSNVETSTSNTTTRVILGASYGAKVRDGLNQITGILARTRGNLPNDWYVFFNAGDVCLQTQRLMTTKVEYRKNIDRMVRHLVSEYQKYNIKVRIHLVHPLSFQQVVASSSILEKPVRFHGQLSSCADIYKVKRELWANSKSDEPDVDAEKTWMLDAMRIPASNQIFCPNLFAPANSTAEWNNRVSALAGRLRTYRDVLDRSAEVWASYLKEKSLNHLVEIIVNTRTSDWRMQPDDIANNCLHLSEAGQQNLGHRIFAK